MKARFWCKTASAPGHVGIYIYNIVFLYQFWYGTILYWDPICRHLFLVRGL